MNSTPVKSPVDLDRQDENFTPLDDAREFLRLIADSIDAVLHDPGSLGLIESQAIESGVEYFGEALSVLAECSTDLTPIAELNGDVTPRQLRRAASLLRVIADRL